MKSFKIFFIILVSFVSFHIASGASTFVFSTPPQHISAGVVSDKINVEAQSPVTETTYLTFTSTSQSGQFLTSSGAPLKSAYISTGDSNRAVYYKDSSPGDFVITAEVLSKDKSKIAEISQHIVVSSSVQNTVVQQATTSVPTNIEDIGGKIEQATQVLQTISDQMKQRSTQKVAVVQKAVVPDSVPEVSSSTSESGTSSANTALVFQVEKKAGFVSNLFAWPIKFFNYIASLF